jgi:PAS domain-containing protein
VVERATEKIVGKGLTLSRAPTLVNAQSFLANFTEALLALDENWRIQYANPLAARMFGKTQDQLASTTLWEQWSSSVRTQRAPAPARIERTDAG